MISTGIKGCGKTIKCYYEINGRGGVCVNILDSNTLTHKDLKRLRKAVAKYYFVKKKSVRQLTEEEYNEKGY